MLIQSLNEGLMAEYGTLIRYNHQVEAIMLNISNQQGISLASLGRVINQIASQDQ